MNPKAIALLSGGLGSTLAVKLILDQGIEVEALNNVTSFCTCNRIGKCEARHAAETLGLPCKTIALFAQLLDNEWRECDASTITRHSWIW
jgi:tRNA-specific 2-thiouridylase